MLAENTASGPGWHGKRRKDRPWFWWVTVSGDVDISGWGDIPGVGFDGSKKAWALPEEVMHMLLLREE